MAKDKTQQSLRTALGHRRFSDLQRFLNASAPEETVEPLQAHTQHALSRRVLRVSPWDRLAKRGVINGNQRLALQRIALAIEMLSADTAMRMPNYDEATSSGGLGYDRQSIYVDIHERWIKEAESRGLLHVLARSLAKGETVKEACRAARIRQSSYVEPLRAALDLFIEINERDA